MINILKEYLPDIVSFIDDGKELDRKLADFKTRYNNLVKKLSEEGDSIIIRPHSIVEWLVAAEAGDEKSRAFLNYTNDVLRFCRTEIDPRLHKKLRSIVWNLVTSFDTDLNLKDNPRYQTYLGELLTVYSILCKKKAFRLEDIEVNLPNGKTADISLTHLKSDEPIIFDIVSINDFNPTKPETEGDVLSFFEYRFNQKLEAKTKGLMESPSGLHVVIDQKEVAFKIHPIIWSELDDLAHWSGVLRNIQTKYANVLPLSILFAFITEQNEINFSFGTVSDAFDTHLQGKA